MNPVVAADAMAAPDGVADPAARVLAEVDQLRQGVAPRFDPTRWHYLQALARRLSARSGPGRAVLAQTLAQALAAYTQRHAQAQAEAQALCQSLVQRWPEAQAPARQHLAEGDFSGLRQLHTRCQVQGPPGLLASLVGRLNRGRPMAAGVDQATPAALAEAPATPPALKAVQQFKSTWARLSVDRQLARSQAQVPDNPGPLNSHLLVLRALQEMQATSPTYLGHFMAYADALLWLDQASFGGLPANLNVVRREGEAVKGAKPAKKTANKPRRAPHSGVTGPQSPGPRQSGQ